MCTRPEIFLRSSRIKIDLLPYESKLTATQWQTKSKLWPGMHERNKKELPLEVHIGTIYSYVHQEKVHIPGQNISQFAIVYYSICCRTISHVASNTTGSHKKYGRDLRVLKCVPGGDSLSLLESKTIISME